MKHIASATLALALALAFVQVALADTHAATKAHHTDAAHSQPVADVNSHGATPKTAPPAPASVARPAAPAGKAPHPATFPDNDGSRFTYDSCGCLGS
jgi:hypothetical protein